MRKFLQRKKDFVVIMKEEEYLKQRQQEADILSYKFLQAYFEIILLKFLITP